MNATTAAQRPSQNQIKRFVEQLRLRGIGAHEFQRATGDPSIMDQIAYAMRVREIPQLDLHDAFDPTAIERLVNFLFGRYIDRARKYDDTPWFYTEGEYDPRDLYEERTFRKLLRNMDQQCLTVLVLRNGLLDNVELPAAVIAERYGVESSYITTLHKRARAHMKAQQKMWIPLMNKQPFPFEWLLFDETSEEVLDTTIAEYFDRSYDTIPLIQPLNDAGIITVRDLKNLPVRQAARLLMGDEVRLSLVWFPDIDATS